MGTGLATIALALLAYDLAGPSAGAVLRAALAIKMVLSVVVSPVVDDVVRHTHIHTDAAPHEHLTGAVAVGDPSRAGPSVWVHTHRVVIDDQHPRRPEVVS